jgi:hypothetical protein
MVQFFLCNFWILFLKKPHLFRNWMAKTSKFPAKIALENRKHRGNLLICALARLALAIFCRKQKLVYPRLIKLQSSRNFAYEMTNLCKAVVFVCSQEAFFLPAAES